MLTNTLIALLVAATGSSSDLPAQPSDRISGFVVLEMKGQLAIEYGKLAGSVQEDQIPDFVGITTTAMVAQHLDDGRVRIEHTSPVLQDGAPIRLVTLTATVDPTAVQARVVPAMTRVYSSPDAVRHDEEPVVTEKETRLLVLELADLNGVKLRSWELATEIGN